MSINSNVNLMAAALSVTGINLDDEGKVVAFLARRDFKAPWKPHLTEIIAVAKAKRAEPSMRKFVAMLFGRAA